MQKMASVVIFFFVLTLQWSHASTCDFGERGKSRVLFGAVFARDGWSCTFDKASGTSSCICVADAPEHPCSSLSSRHVDNIVGWEDGTIIDMVVPASGFPIIIVPTDSSIVKRLPCTNANCDGDMPTNLGTFSTGYAYPSVTLNEEGKPIIGAYKTASGGVCVAMCADNFCEDLSGASCVDTVDWHGDHLDITWDPASGGPVLVYASATGNGAHITSCATPTCDGQKTTLTWESGGKVRHNSVVMGADGFAFAVGNQESTSRTLVLHCGAPSCTTFDVTMLDDTDAGETKAAVVIGADGLPLIVYTVKHVDGARTYLVHCEDSACMTRSRRTLSENDADIGQGFRSAAVRHPTKNVTEIVYTDLTNGNLIVGRCHTPACTGADTRVVRQGTYAAAVLAEYGGDGELVLTWTAANGVHVGHCAAGSLVQEAP
eukprot:TRINITY_DN33073_c0_g1_i1.p1 TRINITY_DN33073_c0_g1~~TRINITY_DN33073_c0_g1_i1.p1  ORF type:complete len:431 (-),score=72.19 TRINITY_DN33073_c0_g1_i1:165-1457(-)